MNPIKAIESKNSARHDRVRGQNLKKSKSSIVKPIRIGYNPEPECLKVGFERSIMYTDHLISPSSVHSERYYLSRLLVANPYTEEGKDLLKALDIKLSVEDFFAANGCYVSPFFFSQESTASQSDTSPEEKSEDFHFKSNRKPDVPSISEGNKTGEYDELCEHFFRGYFEIKRLKTRGFRQPGNSVCIKTPVFLKIPKTENTKIPGFQALYLQIAS